MLRRLPLLFALLASAPALAQEDIVVTGRGLAPALGEEAFDVIVIPRERLTGSASYRIEDILRDIPGFQLFRRSDARSANPTSQGATLRALGGNASSRALLLLDGVPQTDPFGGWVSWPAYDPRRLGEVRVTRGGGSGVNGPGALAGTIELVSASPSELRSAGGGISYGSRDSIDAFAGLGADLGEGFVTVSGAWMRGDGFIPVVEEDRGAVDRPAPYDQRSLALRAVAPVGAGVELQGSGLLFDDHRERGTDFSAIRTQGADASLRLVGRRWSALGYVQTRGFYNSFASVGARRAIVSRAAEQYNVPSTGLGARGEWRPLLGPLELRLGGDWRETVGETREFYFFQGPTPGRAREAGGRTRTVGGFAEGTWSSGGLTLTGGGRLDRWWIRDGFLDERVLATGTVLTDADYAERTGWEPTGRAGIAWTAAEGVTLRSAAYLGWRLPTLNELYRPFRVGADATAANADLAPERLKGIEAGVEWTPQRGLHLGATLFANRLDDAIANVTLGRGPGVFPGVGFVSAAGEYRQRRNLGAIVARGVELSARLRLGAVSLSGGWSLVDAEVRADGAAATLDGLRPAQTPRHSLSSTLAWDGGGARRVSVTARYVGSQYEDDTNDVRIPDAFTLDAAAAWPLARGVSLEARAENVTDARVVAGIGGAGVVERATPRTLWIGLRFGR